MLHRWGEAVVADADILFDAMAGTARASKTRTRLSDPEARQRANLRFAAAMEIDRLQSQIRAPRPLTLAELEALAELFKTNKTKPNKL